MKNITGEIDRDYSTSYSYDKNANITSIFRRGITDVIGGQTRLFGAHTDLYMTYNGNQIKRLTAVGQGADYEGRTGLGTQPQGSMMAYDANGNLKTDETRNILRITYNRRNQPTEITFGDGHRQTISYDGFGRKLRTDYSQVPETMVGSGMQIYSDKLYELRSTREYVGPYIFTDGKLEYSAFGGGYFDPEQGAMYYVTDWQGNNAAVVDRRGNVVQQTIYYPYGELTIEPVGQRYLFGGKEREHAGDRNTYDFGARCLTPYGNWGVTDRRSDDYYPFSPYVYCKGDPVNHIDPDGEAVWVITALIGAGIDFTIQMSVHIVSGKSFTAALKEVDYTSVLASAATSAFFGPGAGAKRRITSFAINIADAAVDVKGNGVEYIGHNKRWRDAIIDAGIAFVPFGVKHEAINLSGSPVKSYYGEGAARTITKEELEQATEIGTKFLGGGLKEGLNEMDKQKNGQRQKKQMMKTAPTDAIKAKATPPSIDQSKLREKLNQKKLYKD